MIPADVPSQRPPDARLLVADRHRAIEHRARAELVGLFRGGDLVIANDAATLPSSLAGYHAPTGRGIEVRLAGWHGPALDRVKSFSAVVFGAGDYRTRTEDRALPPELRAADRLVLGPLEATITRLLNHPRMIELEFEGTARAIWEGLARHGKPIQYSHLRQQLAIWDTWTPIAGPPVAFEPPSAGFVLDWNALKSMRASDVHFRTITHAAGISSTGDPELDALLPFDEPYRITRSTARAIAEAQGRGGRIVAIGTTVVRALEHAAGVDGKVRAGNAIATQRIGASTQIRIVDAVVSGTHERGTSHYELLRAFADDELLGRMDHELDTHAYRTHEFGDSVFIEKAAGHILHEARIVNAA